MRIAPNPYFRVDHGRSSINSIEGNFNFYSLEEETCETKLKP